MENLVNLSLGEIVKQNYRASVVFERYGLDFCCMGSQQLGEACQASEINTAEVVQALNALSENEEAATNFDAWPLDLLADYIYQRHHKYVEKKTPLIKGYLDKICSVHGKRHPELEEIRAIFYESSGELAVHMKKEELMLFPYIKRMVAAQAKGDDVQSPMFGSVISPVEVMKADHRDEGEQLQRMATLSNAYTPPADACSTYTVTYKMLKEYERDMHLHIHLENNILFTKAVALEELLRKKV